MFKESYTLSSVTHYTQSDPKLTLEGINKFYTTHDYIYHELSYLLYPDHTSTIPYSIEKGIFIKQGDAQYSQLASIESLTTKEYTVGIDNDEKIVMISNHITISPTGPLADADTWMTSDSKATIQPVSDQLNALSISLDDGEVEKAVITYDVKTFQPVKLVLIYRRSIQLSTEEETTPVQPRLEIEYTRTSFDTQGKGKLDISGYVLKKGSQWVLSPKYKDYELINTINEYPEQN
jgi:hypothetical protein